MGNDLEGEKDFDRLDTEHSGALSLDKLQQFALEEARYLSVLLLFKFDHDREGSLTFKEWKELLENVREAEKKVKKLTDTHEKIGYGEIWNVASSDTVLKEYDLDRESETPAFLTNAEFHHHEEHQKEDSVTKRKKTKKYTEEQLRVDAKLFLDKFLETSQGCNAFLDWLWRLVDIHKSSKLKVPELALLIAALRRDGIMTSDVSFVCDSEKEVGTPELGDILGDSPGRSLMLDNREAEKLLREYDVGGKGFLSESEFSVLGNMILGVYRSRTYSVFNE